MRAWVVYESMFGDNQRVAAAIAEGLRTEGIDAESIEVGAAETTVPGDVGLLVVGSPNHSWSLPRASTRKEAAARTDRPLVSQGIGVREWLAAAKLRPGLPVAAYDTRGTQPKVVVALDRASTQIQKGLTRRGGAPVAPPRSFRVTGQTGPLAPGEIEHAHLWGRQLAGLVPS